MPEKTDVSSATSRGTGQDSDDDLDDEQFEMLIQSESFQTFLANRTV